jgi:2-oxoglutarate dehydrogenase E2 component (dihydrolipoamide succinyltransferase)/2-oxoisovalerate dehydrogenase E2 component (dihydrolipoyl transacylase)
MNLEVVMPQMGESVAEGTVVTWLKKVGERVAKDEPLVAISTDKVDVEIPSPAPGILTRILVHEGQVVPVGAVLAYIGEPAISEPASAGAFPAATAPRISEIPTGVGLPPPRPETWYSPSVLHLAKEHGVDLAQIRGTGSDGRVTRKDVLNFIAGRPMITAAPLQREPQVSGPAAAEDRILPISRLRKTIAEHMVRSKQTAPHVTQIHEADVTAITRYREANKAGFFERTGVNLTFLPFIVKATVDALKTHPLLNASYTDEGIVLKDAINIGIAVALEEGLIVPVLRDANKKSFTRLAGELADLATRAREKRLTPDDVQRGTFTVNNIGAFGALIGTPIIVQPQVAILGFGRVAKRPVVMDDTIAIRSMVYLCLSFDHRLIDGAYAGPFLNDLQSNLEGFDGSHLD